jgi:hypothetical protein
MNIKRIYVPNAIVFITQSCGYKPHLRHWDLKGTLTLCGSKPHLQT